MQTTTISHIYSHNNTLPHDAHIISKGKQKKIITVQIKKKNLIYIFRGRVARIRFRRLSEQRTRTQTNQKGVTHTQQVFFL